MDSWPSTKPQRHLKSTFVSFRFLGENRRNPSVSSQKLQRTNRRYEPAVRVVVVTYDEIEGSGIRDLLHNNVKRFRIGFLFKADGFVSLNSRLDSNKEEEEVTHDEDAPPV